MEKTFKNRKKLIQYCIIALVVVFLLSTGFLLLELWERQEGRFLETSSAESNFEYNGVEYQLRDNVETFLVMGLDKFGEDVSNDSYRNSMQADFVMLFVFDNDAKTYTAIHVNRDSMVGVNRLDLAGNAIEKITMQLALAHTYGNGKDVSCRNTADSVSELLHGIKVNHYISFTMDSVTIMNDLVGGVQVTVLDDFTGVDDTLVKGETVTLMGEHALNYVRTRYGLDDSTNIARMARQQQYISALQKQFTKCVAEDDGFVAEAALQMSDYIISDRSITQLQELAKKLTEYDFEEIVDIEGESVVGETNMEFYPDDDDVLKTVVELFYAPKK